MTSSVTRAPRSRPRAWFAHLPEGRRGLAAVLMLLLAACGGGGGGGVTTAPATPLPTQLSITAGARSEPGTALSFASSLGAGSEGLTLTWEFGDGTGSTSAQPTHAFTAPGDYDVRLTVRNAAGQSASASARVQVARFGLVADRLCSGEASTGWCWLAPLPYAQSVTVERFFTADLGVVAGPSGWFEITTDGGRTWTRRPRAPFAFVDVAMVDAQNGWALDNTLQAVHRTRDGGRSWEAKTGMDFRAVQSGARLTALGPDRLLVHAPPQASVRQAFYTADGGASWSLVPSPSTPILANGNYWQQIVRNVLRGLPGTIWDHYRVTGFGPASGPVPLPVECHWSVVPPDDALAWAVCHSPLDYLGAPFPVPVRSAVRVSRDGGQSWSEVSAAMPSAPNGQWRLSDVALDAAGEGFGVFSLLNAGEVAQSSLLRVSAGASSWLPLPPPPEFGAYHLPYLPVLDARTAWLLDATGRPWWSDDGAARWQALQNAAAPGPRPGSLVRDGGGGLLARYDEPELARFRSTDRGQSWSRLPGGLGIDRNLTVQSLWLFDARRGLAGLSDGSLRVTDDGGRSWLRREAAPMPGATWRSIEQLVFTTPSIGWHLDSYALRVSRDGGASWATSPLPAMLTRPAQLHFVDVQNGWIVDLDGRLFASHDGGQQWAAAPQPAGAQHWAQLVRFVDARTGVLVVNEGNIDTSVWHTTDGGQNWRSTNFRRGGGGRMAGLVYADARTVWMAGERVVGESLWKSSDAGATWQPVAVPTEASIERLAFADARHGWFVAGGQLYGTVDGGATWQRQNDGGLQGAGPMFWLDAKTGWIGGAHGSILATVTGGR